MNINFNQLMRLSVKGINLPNLLDNFKLIYNL